MEKKRLSRPLLIVPVIIFGIYLFMTQNNSASTDSGAETLLEQTLQEMEGVGQVKIYVHYEQQTQALLSDYFRSSEGGVTGVLIVSEGAVEPKVQRELLQVVSRVMQIPAHRIMIVPMRKKGDES
ncbi:hypothetical protein [Solibacillus sp. CAU 1738]|uniref:hypothetical protein n=1 Tax=Solibacillus sp. CAU 1738 TaxID=3140363 RepID=UPI0032601555